MRRPAAGRTLCRMRSPRPALVAVTVVVALHALMLIGAERLSSPDAQSAHAAGSTTAPMNLAPPPASLGKSPDSGSDRGHDMAISCLATLIALTALWPGPWRRAAERLVPAIAAPPRPPAVRPPIPWTTAPDRSLA
jgi:hypothetical protein